LKVRSSARSSKTAPIDTEIVLGVFQKAPRKMPSRPGGGPQSLPNVEPHEMAGAVALLRKAADLIDQRTFEIGAAMAMEVGKNRMESLGDVAETADLIRYSCYQMEKNDGYIVEMGRDPLVGYTSTNFSVLRPYGVWLVISPFNFPARSPVGPAARRW
jgi:1-pyrroline-5-carboxylate dehydrogenase